MGLRVSKVSLLSDANATHEQAMSSSELDLGGVMFEHRGGRLFKHQNILLISYPWEWYASTEKGRVNAQGDTPRQVLQLLQTRIQKEIQTANPSRTRYLQGVLESMPHFGPDPFHEYLLDRVEAGDLSTSHIGRVQAIWTLVRPQVSDMLPIAMPTSDGALQLAWTKNDRHVSADVYEHRWDWFSRNRTTDEVTGGESEDFDTLPPELVACLADFTK